MRNERGYTLLELCTVIVIIGILAALALMKFGTGRDKGNDARVASAVRHIATVQEAYFTQNQEYTANVGDLPGAVVDDVVIEVEPGNSGSLASSFRVKATHPSAGHTFVWISDPGPGESNLTSAPKGSDSIGS